MIRNLTGDDLGVPRIPECCVVEWAEQDKRVVFSYAQQGKGITIHLASDSRSLRHLKAALNEFCEWLFWAYSWCEMVFAMIGRQSIERLVRKCGFEWLTRRGGLEIYMRARA